ncbi:hypothetical protein [Halorarius litoreus]|uniref:hypothetical protein n=1 Tax=Halorarius litoreus TaxID=2962676 RepID=UPI0020CF1443|nr:hypothetical protein [Halorarius litoreus]
MDVGTALDEAGARLRSRAGLVLLVAFLVVAVAAVLARQTLLAASLTQFLAQGGDPATLPVPPEDLRPVALALPVGYGTSLGLFALVALASEYLSIVTLRTVAGESLQAAATRRLGPALVVGIVVGVLVKTLVLVGLIAFLLPGLYIATVLLFAHARVAIDDAGVVDALAGSRRLVRGRVLSVGAVVATLVVLYLFPRLASGFLPVESTGLLVGGLLVGLANLLSTALVARAYVGIREAGAEEEPQEETEDPYDAPLGPDDLPEP